ncbi:MAG: N-acetylmuramoyl-L-alanine amidase [Methylacidiphilales bacterium]|nr:N-acetylmuramoyl-L-alanine amidase [Candidatus Methylacidiphilales bacterium]MDW8349450.1 N-acetylmuramoyl-L-alanine amidase [Verrucomicrobiae bacterium]
MRARSLWLHIFLIGMWSAFGGSLIAQTQPPDYHVVRRGETLYQIARYYGISPRELMAENQIRNPTRLQIGQRLRIPTPQKSTSASDESAIQNGYLPPHTPTLPHTKETPPLNPSSKRISSFLRPIIHLMEIPRVKRGRWKYVVVHHSGASSGNAKIMDSYHRRIGMENGLAYHFVIGNGRQSRDGQIEVGHRWVHQIAGGHLYDDRLNEISIGICLIGNFNRHAPTKRQIAATTELIRYLNQRCGRRLIFRGHREINARPTDCPGRYFPLRAFHRLFN